MDRQKVGLLLFLTCAVTFSLTSIYHDLLSQFDLTQTTLKFPNFQSLGFLTNTNDENQTNQTKDGDNQITMMEPIIILNSMNNISINNVPTSMNTTTIVTNTSTLAEGIREASKCVPNYKIMQANEKRDVAKTAFLLLSAYEYADQIVVTLQADGYNGSPVFCRYLDENLDEVGGPLSSSVFYIATVHCCSRKGVKYMSVTFNETEPIKQWTALNDRTMTEPKYNLSLCLAPIFGEESKWLMLAETIEHYRLQGVQHYYLYIKDMDTYSRYLVEDYLRSGDVEVIWFEYRQGRYHFDWQYFGINDCLQRARLHSKYAIFADLDERITPSGNETLLELVTEEFGKSEKIGGIAFRPRWVLRDKPVPKTYEGAQTLNESLTTMVFRNTSHWPGLGYVSKMILDPKQVLVMWIHWVHQYAPGSHAVDIPPERAIIRHYRDIYAGNWANISLAEIATFGEFTQIEYPPQLMKSLYKNILERLERVYTKILYIP